MLHYLNNCRNRDHATLYGGNAFYDLDTYGRDAKHISKFQLGDDCVVASKTKDHNVEFAWYKFTGSRYTNGGAVFVLCGTLVRRERMPKSDAAHSHTYSIFFNVRGHFKQVSVLHDA